MDKKIGAVAYKLKLPTTCGIHPVIHVSQLKKALALGEIIQEDLPQSTEVTVPARVLRQRLHRAGLTSGTQVLVQWSGSSQTSATWEDLRELQSRFPHAPAWGQASPEDGGNVTEQRCGPDGEQRMSYFQRGDRQGRRRRKPLDRYPTAEWVS